MVDLSAGQLVADKYRIDGVIGAGGMGVVLAATRLDLDQLVAIKVLRDATDEAIARFQREARVIVRLKSDHVARVFDVGTLDDETPYYVMERLEGEDLSKALERRGPLPIDQAVDYVLEACEAIAEAHTLGMVHRDLKPANLFVARGPGGIGSVKVLDFGVSKALLNEGSQVGELTDDGVALGSPGYMAPEQIESSRSVDARADIYSLGAILYRLTSGFVPYKGETLMSVLASMSAAPLTPLSERVPGIPPRFAQIVERCLAQDPVARPANVALLAKELVPFGTRKAQASVEQIFATMGHSTGPTSETITLEHGVPVRKTETTPLVTDDPSTVDHAADTATTPLVSTARGAYGLSATMLAPPALTPPALSPPVLPAIVADPLPITATSRPSPTRNPNILPLGIAAGFLVAVVVWVALWRRSPPPPPRIAAPPPSVIVIDTAEPSPIPLPSTAITIAPVPAPLPDPPSTAVTEPEPSSVVSTPIAQPRPSPQPRPTRHPTPAPRPAPKRDPNAPPNLTDMPGGRH
ncbi:MAG: serine/threonine protein kinase [Labilithrix sp.]|nr:serine/threonine protein kinase [Labilithrix sp.]MCW5810356.1 serine/threonine protein kinase [Labilithrix sp.]